MERITQLIDAKFGEQEIITNKELKGFLTQLKDTETKILVKVHKDGKNTILSNETSHNAIKRLFHTIH